MADRYDTIIIGAGLSGLAAGIRLAHFEKRVLVIEAHSLCGGLNSWYKRGGAVIDVGLHAMTNFIPKGGGKGPLTKLMRQLRLTYDDLELIPQRQSSIVFPDRTLTFTNDISQLTESVNAGFPEDIEGFLELSRTIDAFNEVDLNPPRLSARDELSRFITDPTLIDMLLTPLMFYGNPQQDDMDFAQFAVMWKSIFGSGFARPAKGMRHVITLLVERYTSSGGELLTNSRVTSLTPSPDGCKVRLEDGTRFECDNILSCAGHNETLRLVGSDRPSGSGVSSGRLSFVEQVFFLDCPPADLGLSESIVFFNHHDRLVYRQPDDAVDYTNGVICCPENFGETAAPDRHEVRVTLRASYPEWKATYTDEPADYTALKSAVTAQLIDEVASRYISGIGDHIVFSDLFTPLTIERFSGHDGGAVYGSPDKCRTGDIGIPNIKLIGTDQGFLGIVGAMLSGITIANQSLSNRT